MFEHIKKRDGKIVKFDPLKITSAIAKAGKAAGEFELEEPRSLVFQGSGPCPFLVFGSCPDGGRDPGCSGKGTY